MEDSNVKRELLRHTVATLAYRAGKTIRDAPDFFAELQLSQSSRTPLQILTHMGDLFEWALSMVEGRQDWQESPVMEWEEAVDRFFRLLHEFDACLARPEALGFPEERIFQGPIADALSHVGQLGILRRLAKAPVRGENYFLADIQAGRVGLDQSRPQKEFD